MEKMKVVKILNSSTNSIMGVVINDKTYMETEDLPFKQLLLHLIQKYGRPFEDQYFSKDTKTIVKEIPFKITTITDKNYKKVLGVVINNKAFIETKYQSFEELLPKIIEAYGEQFKREYYSENNKCITIEEYNNQITQQLEQKVNNQTDIKIKNTKLHQENINLCREEVLSGKQIRLKHSKYTLGQMTATQDVGKNRSGQEDSVIILEHPKNKDFKLMAVSDGVGGAALGEIASNTIAKNLTIWFENLDPSIYDDVTKIQKDLKPLLKNILKEAPIPEESSATLSAVIIGKTQTLITNLGDSRVYTTKRNQIKQETKDDSYVQELFEHNKIPNKEIMRFHEDSNVITSGINKQGPLKEPNFTIIPNKSYDRIIATSDGAADLISEQTLEKIIKHSKPQEITDNIVNYALNNDSYLEDAVNNLPLREKVKTIETLKHTNGVYHQLIKQGKDNTSVVSFAKK